MKVAIRVDASEEIGIGHLRRCLSLCRALRTLGAEVQFVTRDLGLPNEKIIADHCDEKVFVLSAGDELKQPETSIPHGKWAKVSQAQDIRETVSALETFKPDWVVIDSYAFDAHWHNGVRDALNCRIAQIDELPDRKFAPDLLIDQTLSENHREKFGDCLEKNAKILGGPRFALLDPAYAEASRYRFNDEVRSIGVFMGGADAGNYSVVVLDALDEIGFEGLIEIVTTTANRHLAELRKRVSARTRTRLSVDLPNLAEFYARHDLQVGAGGSASWERCCIGVPTLLVEVALNQQDLADRLAAVRAVALASQPTSGAIATKLAILLADISARKELARSSSKLVDGLGARRVALRMLAETLVVRPVTPRDAQIVFDWRNHADTRASSISNASIEWNEHREWIDHVCADPTRKMFVGEIGEAPVGVVRFDLLESNVTAVSIFLRPDLHGLGIGSHLLLEGENAVESEKFEATILETNWRSQAMFERCGYQKVAADKWMKHRH